VFSLAACAETKAPISAFLFFFLLGSIFSYGTTIVLFIPGLYCLSKITALRFHKVCLLGIFLGATVFFPLAWVMCKASGPDSGPPDGTHFAFISGSWGDTFTRLFPVGGLITAIAYWLLVNMPSQRNRQPSTRTEVPRSLT
jgi:hypothetical protein